MKIDEKLMKVMGMAAGGLIVLILIIALISSCSNSKTYSIEKISELETKLIGLAKSYYSNNESELPKEGSSVNLSIQSLVDAGKIKPLDKIITGGQCSGQITVTNNNGYYLYLPKLDCGSDYKYKVLTEAVTSEENIVNSGNGLYKVNGEYIFRGENVNNYLSFGEKIWLILKVNADGSLRIMETTKRDSIVWDDRYNSERSYDSGINEYLVNNINSRLKDSIEAIYNSEEEFTDSEKAYFLKQSICIGKRSEDDTINDGSIECANKLDNSVFGLIQANEYIQASLDQNCNSALSDSCTNYNYLANMTSSIWTITADKNSSFKVFKISYGLALSNASSYGSIRIVAHLTKETLYGSGSGTIDDPYKIIYSA